MSFIDLLRQSRSSSIATLHKFLTNYNPGTQRVHAFVEGEPDRVFYRTCLERHCSPLSKIFVYNCEGKKRVYEIYSEIIKRHPTCRRVLFFVDKDVDDIVGITWPSDPRIFTTEVYSVENYVICDHSCARYFRDFVKVRRVEIDMSPFIEEFARERKRFHALLLPIMAWIIAYRRRGGRVILTDINLDSLFGMNATVIFRRAARGTIKYLARFRTTSIPPPDWTDVRSVCGELKRIDAKGFVRGHFEAWWFVKFVQKLCEDLNRAVAEIGGSIAIGTALTENNFIQILSPGVNCPLTLERFLKFHLDESATLGASTGKAKRRSIKDWLNSLFMNRR
jgi:Protein of unknown function (DUF4435)